MSYNSYRAEDFASDANFKAWVLSQDVESNYFWEKWLLSNPDKRMVVDQARVMVLAMNGQEVEISTTDIENVWDRIDASVNALEKTIGEGKILPMNADIKFSKAKAPAKNSKFNLKKLLSIAAAFIMVLAVTWFMNDKQSEKPIPVPEIKFITKEVTKGQKLKMFLPDGSEIVLNSSSKITFPEKFSADARVVELSGEAFFEVKKDSLAPFIVKTGSLQTKVLGTSFNVKAYQGESLATVTLVEGQVSVTEETIADEIILAPGEQVEMDITSGKVSKGKIKDRMSLEWRNGILSFKDAQLKDVFAKLEQWYGVTIQVDKIPVSKKITGTFENEYLSNVLNSIQYSIQFDFKIKGDSVFITFKKQSP